NKLFHKFYKAYQYLILNYKAIKNIIKEYGKPKLVHCYVFFPVGIIAVFLKYKLRVPLILTEHWTAFYKEDPGYLKNHSFLSTFLYKRILKCFELIMRVAKRVEVVISERENKKQKVVMPNVVDTDVFFYTKKENKKVEFTFIHVSTMGYQKNLEGILEVF